MAFDKDFTRRTLLKGAGAGAAALATINLVGCGSDAPKTTDGEPQVIEDASKVTNVTEEYKGVDCDLSAHAAYDLPLGAIPYHCEGSWAALLETPESARSVNALGVISLSSGNRVTLLSRPLQGAAFGFHDVRCASSVFCWIEMNYAAGDWVLIAQGFSDGSLTGDPVELDHGNADWEPARFTAWGDAVIWQKMPLATGSKRAEHSHCNIWHVGDSEGAELYDSPGRFATWPQVSEGMLTIAPRVRADEGTYYGISALDLENKGKLVDQLVMPKNVSPFAAVYMNGGFAFSVEANYGYGGALGNMGTFIGREGGPFVFLSREPLACVAGRGTRYLIKAQSSHFVVDTEAQTYAVLIAPDKSLDFGDYPASAGTTDAFATFATVRGDDGTPAFVRMRVFAL